MAIHLFEEPNFLDFASKIKIRSKESGIIPLHLNPVQRYLLDEIKVGLANGKHRFVILKSRQEGITTLSCAITIYVCEALPGTQGMLIAGDDPGKESLRKKIRFMIDSLPEEWTSGVAEDNRYCVGLANGSTLFLRHAGYGGLEGGELGRGEGLTYIYGTEMGLWKDPTNYDSLMASFAEKNPYRLGIFEGTAKGIDNLFREIWTKAQNSSEQVAIFLGWWRNPSRRIPRNHPLFKKWWNGRLTPEEKQWVSEVKKQFGFDITDEQIAWARMTCEEKFRGHLSTFYQEFPPTPEYAWQSTGSRFFPSIYLNRCIDRHVREPIRSLRFEYSSDFLNCKVLDCDPEDSDLSIWQPPSPGAKYVMGADPAWGCTDFGSNFCFSLWRCWANRMEQVAEFCTPSLAAYQFAWTIAYVCGQYKDVFLILEINGGGSTVMQELFRLQQLPRTYEGGEPSNMLDFRNAITHYLYKRVDSLSKPNCWHWKTTGGPSGTKQRMMYAIKDLFLQGILIPRSERLIVEMSKIYVLPGGEFQTEGGENDDRVMASAMACIGFTESVRYSVYRQIWTPEMEEKERITPDRMEVTSWKQNYKDLFYDQFYGYLLGAGVITEKEMQEMRYGRDIQGMPLSEVQ
ncbi:conserved hypothetical protein [Candidatus Methylacidithermus pantelleriae]|uniref:Terminase n=2 Tax=Candidatus Methylacidithermus pantelleriae TaxID=2744239 RepID=A0A8J2FTL0_9BACT|nr:conserved hypothetical protein [Candidatus Methylacidithermus pantelleriae]